jgi:hypothetical protein
MSHLQYPVDPLMPMAGLKHIPPGKYTAIDEQFYRPMPTLLGNPNDTYGGMGVPLIPQTKIKWNPTPFIKREPSLLRNQINNVNYGTYIYNKITGFQ